jgi:hypothetical protein
MLGTRASEVTRRKREVSLMIDTPLDTFDLDVEKERNIRDIERYIAQRSKLGSADISKLAQKSEGNFAYARFVVLAIEAGTRKTADIDDLPPGLDRYYADHFKRMGMDAKPAPRAKLRIIYLLSEAMRPISRQLIAKLSGDDEITVQEVLDELLAGVSTRITFTTVRAHAPVLAEIRRQRGFPSH